MDQIVDKSTIFVKNQFTGKQTDFVQYNQHINEQDCFQLLTRFVVLIQFPFDQPPSIKFAQNQCPKMFGSLLL
jgi:hypothetical protein